MCHVYGVVLHYLILHVGLLSGNNLENSNSTVGLAEGATVSKKTPPLSDQTGVTFWDQKSKWGRLLMFPNCLASHHGERSVTGCQTCCTTVCPNISTSWLWHEDVVTARIGWTDKTMRESKLSFYVTKLHKAFRSCVWVHWCVKRNATVILWDFKNKAVVAS